MKKILLILFAIINLHLYATDAQIQQISFEVESQVRQYSKIKCDSIIIGKDADLQEVAKIIKYDLTFTDQLDVSLKLAKNKLNKKTEEKLFDDGVSLILYLEKKGKNKLITELKDTSSNQSLFKKEFTLDKKDLIYSAHKISDELLPVLTGEPGICLNSLAYCKRVSPRHQIICVSDYACKKEKSVVLAKTINVAPRWHTQVPTLFYSQFTKVNNRLMSVDIKTQKHKVICSYDGLNMQPDFSDDGKRAALCLSGGENSEIYLYDYALCKKLKKRVFLQLTHNGGNNSSPFLLPNGDLGFCSDFELGNPQLYYLSMENKKIKRLTSGRGYCAASSYCPKNNSVVYSKVVNGVFQLFTLNLEDLQEKQLTFGMGDKHEPEYSSCGRFVAFSFDKEYQKGRKTFQIAILNIRSGKIRILTKGAESKTFPRWSNNPFFA